MTVNWLRRTCVLAALASAALLAACGSGTIESQLRPSRIISFGDGLSDVGQTSNAQIANARYTVNDGSTNIWAQQLAASYGLPLTSAASGGLGFAQGNARVVEATDAAGGTAPSIKAQIDAFLASGSFGANDLVLVNGGISDIVAQTEAFRAGALTSEQLLVNVDQAGKDLGAQVRRLVSAGAKFVVVVGAYGLGKSPYASDIGQTALLDKLSFAGESGINRPRSFNEALLT